MVDRAMSRLHDDHQRIQSNIDQKRAKKVAQEIQQTKEKPDINPNSKEIAR